MVAEREQVAVLVVDDNPQARKLMQIVLEHAGYRVSTAVDGAEAKAALLAGPLPDLLVADLMMPGMNGIELLGWVRDSFKDRRPGLILLTAMDSAETSNAAIAAGVDDVATKPFDRTEFLGRLAGVLDTVRQR